MQNGLCKLYAKTCSLFSHQTQEAGWNTVERTRFSFVPGSRNSQIRKRGATCSDFGEKLEVLTSAEQLKIFFTSCFHAGCEKKERV